MHASPWSEFLHHRHTHEAYCRLKCNRGSPCDSCVRRGLSSLCTYAPNASRGKPASSGRGELKDRLNTLENLVSSFLSVDAVIRPRTSPENQILTGNDAITGPSGIGVNTPSEQESSISGSTVEEALTPETPHLQETLSGQVNYIDRGHWLSILDDIKEVREHLYLSSPPVSQNETVLSVDCPDSDAGFHLGSPPDASLDDILTSLPSRSTCDMLLSWYFNSRFMVLGKTMPFNLIRARL